MFLNCYKYMDTNLSIFNFFKSIDSQCVITTETDLPNQPPKETTTVTSKLHLPTVNHLTNASKMSVIGSAKTTIKPCSRKMKRGKRDTACESGSNHDSAHEDEIPVSSSDKMFKHAKYVLRFTIK